MIAPCRCRVLAIFAVLLVALTFGGATAAPPQGTKIEDNQSAHQEKAAADHHILSFIGSANDKPTQPEALAPAVILYDQTDSAGANSINSQDFEAAYNAYDNQGADDFIVTGAGWSVNNVVTPGVFFNGAGPTPTVHVTFFNDAGGLPGAVVAGCDYPAVATFTGGATGSFNITLTPACSLTAGPKWVSVIANMSFAAGGQWGWTERTVQSNSPSAWRNPGGGFGTPCSAFGARAAFCGVGDDPDFVFQIGGTIASCANDAQCSDGNLCNGVETCVANVCSPGTPVNCDDGLFCTLDSCNPADGTCSHAPNTCSDNDGCTVDTCVEATDTCSHFSPPSVTFCNTAPIIIPNVGIGTPYPSSILVSGVNQGTLCSVRLNNLTHTFADDIDVLLGGPAAPSQNSVIMSDVGGGAPGPSNVTLTIKDGAPPLPDGGPLVTGTFGPNNVGTGDPFPAPAPATANNSTLAPFTGNLNGTWNLWVVDDAGGDLGSFGGGWCVNLIVSGCTQDSECSDGNACNGIETCSSGQCAPGTPVNCDDNDFCTVDTCDPATGACSHAPNPCEDGDGCTADSCSNGACQHVSSCVQFCNDTLITIRDTTTPPTTAIPYPSPILIAGQGASATLASVELRGITHTFADDLDILLVGPLGGAQNAIIMSDVGGGAPGPNNVTLILSDAAAASIPDGGPLVSGSFKPTNVNPGTGTEAWPAPAPAPAGGSALAVFNGDPNGTWNLFVVDDQGADSGTMGGGWCLNIRVAGCQTPSECNDQNPCTTDTCDNGVCNHAPVVCDDQNPCTTDTCSPATGGCVSTPTAAGTPCTDGNPCTTEACNGQGVCANTGTVVCNDNNQCTDDLCSPAAGGCVFTPDDTNTCDDGSACSFGDHCVNGTCTPTSGQSCDDGNACTQDGCDAGGCTHTLIDCNDHNKCTNDSCNPTSGCVNVPVSCDDGNACTSDTCTPSSGCSHTAIVCNDGNACTNDSCNPTSGCTTTPVDCSDGNACSDDACNPTSGCTHTAHDCSDQNKCTNDSCNPTSGCVNAPVNCDDGNACSTDACNPTSGCTHTTIDCNDHNKCTNDACNPTSGCVNTPVNCDDGNACTADTCDTASGCAHTGITCNDNNPCTDDSCSPTSGCTFTPNNQSCNDGNACTTGDRCSGGSCQGGAAANCDDQNPCTDDTCSPATGCGHTNNTAPCSDGNACTTNDRCAGGACVGGPAPNCNDNSACTADSCNPTTGCVNPPISCNDGNPCTTDTCNPTTGCSNAPVSCDDQNPCTFDSCNPTTGACQHSPANCNDNNACTTDTCDPVLGCVYGMVVCNDGDLCTNDSCNPSSGCVFSPVSCDDGNVCTTDTCSPAGGCAHAPVSCDDGNACTNDSCTPSGGCQHSNTVCNDNNPCTDDTCTPSGCLFTPVPNRPCDDGNPCTGNDTCGPTGQCSGTGGPNCDDGDACTDDFCSPVTGCSHVNNDYDNDGLCGPDDECPHSIGIGGTVVVQGCDSHVPNVLLENGCTIMDLIARCDEQFPPENGGSTHNNHTGRSDDNVACIKALLDDLYHQGVITKKQRAAILKCVTRKSPHSAHHQVVRGRSDHH